MAFGFSGVSSLGRAASYGEDGYSFTKDHGPGIYVRISIRYLGQVSKALREIAAGIDDWRPFFKKHFTPAYVEDLGANFGSEGGLVGGWDLLSPEYEKWKASVRPGRPINVFTGKLQTALTGKGRSKWAIREYSPREMAFGVALPHAYWVHERRPILLKSSQLNKTKYTRILRDYLKEVQEKATRRGR